jgi:class 3 adenylate cyclase
VEVEVPEPRYVKAEDGAYIAYQVVGDGSVDIAWQFDFTGDLDAVWESPWQAVWFESLASFARLILHDRRATGLSSRDFAPPNLETRAADLRAVLDAAESRSVVLGGWFESLAPCVLLASSEPALVRALVWWNPNPRTIWAPDYPWGWGPDQVAQELEALKLWGTLEYGEVWADQFESGNGFRPSQAEVRAMAKQSRQTCTPDVVLELTRIWWDTDIRSVLPAVRVPTLLMANAGEVSNVERAEYVAGLIPGAETVVFPQEGDRWPSGRDALLGFARPRLEAIQRFIGIQPQRASVDTILSTVLFTDIVGSAERQARLGDRGWKDLVERHHAAVRAALEGWRGVENDTAGDGFYATFDGPARAIHCAHEIRDRVRDLGVEIRAGVHTGECELIDGKCGGIAVTTGARIAALAGPSQVLVSQTVKDLVAGSGFTFDPEGEHELKGVPDRWRLYAVR